MMWKYNCGTSKLEAIKSKQHPTFESPESYKDFDFSIAVSYTHLTLPTTPYV